MQNASRSPKVQGANIARGGKVTQSSVGWNGVPGRAIDGKRYTNYGQRSCSHTNHDQNPWWRLDLLKTYKIISVTVTNRRDCCHDRIKGAVISIGNSPDGNDGSRCAVIASLGPGATKTFQCKGLVGRYVTIVIPGRKEYLTLCEVEVTGQPSGDIPPTGTNIARGGKVTQSSVGWNGVPERAIDGKHYTNYGQRSCSHTNHDQNPWWRLDLLKTYKINSVTVTNRKDCCHDRIKGAEIRIGNSPDGNDGSRCAVIASLGPGATKTFQCKGLVGRYVTIVIPGRKEYLTLCEVEVTGIESDESDDSNENACG
ncbi:uncharacterized protein LOC131976757 [Centropristis striata]|uniref:uncharacterized protein LOC131976757 n=1 Tax=Centropristis striata TaxID=184440 RepID=UPI0027DEBF0F|nr:uncharacterized protein LOC131976757 [Centropristis striata]